jgi:hypothetical protein
MTSTNKHPNPWFAARKLLIQDFENGRILDTMDAEEVHGLRDEYEAVRIERFRPNLNRLKANGFKIKKATANNKETKQRQPSSWTIAKPLAAEQDYSMQTSANFKSRMHLLGNFLLPFTSSRNTQQKSPKPPTWVSWKSTV